jgi:hypothetical protein
VKNVTRFSISVLLATLVLGFATKMAVAKDPATMAAQERVRAKVGIQVYSGERRSPAKTTETLKARDFLRVYVIPEDDAYVYVVHNNGKTLTLLNAQDTQTPVPKGSLVILPAPEKSYQIDGNSSKESITIICSPTEVQEVIALFRDANVLQQRWTALEEELLAKSKIELGEKPDKRSPIAGSVAQEADEHLQNVLQQRWTALEEALLAKSKIELTQKPDRPFQIAGNVRAMANDPFVNAIPIFSGKAMVVKKYSFQIQQ